MPVINLTEYRQSCLLPAVGPNLVDTSGGDNILRKEERMFRLRVVLLFTGLDQCFGGSFFLNDNAT